MTNTDNYFVKLNQIAWEIEKKNNLTYISWATAWEMLKKEYPKATYTIYETVDWFPFWESKFGIDCKVWVTVNELEHIIRLPVMDWANKAQRAESYTYTTKYGEKTCEAATQFDINKAIQRALTKAMAMHWIWLYVYRGEDLPEQPKPEFTAENLEKIAKVKDNFKNAVEAIKKAESGYEVSQDMKDKITLLYTK